jgi:hypothetical protein
MNTIALKKNFHLLIDSIENEKLLLCSYELMKKRFSSTEGQLWNSLTPKEKDELLLSFEESENSDNLVSHVEMVKKHKKWL